MAINATAVWRIRVGGSDTNGGGYDSAISGAGTDYTDQDVSQLSLTDIVCTGTTTVTSVVGGFTTAMIGNAIRITGGGATSGWYYITARTDTNTITVDRTPGTVAAGTGKVGGAVATLQSLMLSTNAAGNKVVAGNTIYIRGSGVDRPTSNDYTQNYFGAAAVSGDLTIGRIKIIGYNGRPRIGSTGLIVYNCSYIHLENLYFFASSSPVYPLIGTVSRSVIRNCIIDLNNQTTFGLFSLTYPDAGNLIEYCEIFSHLTTPTGTGAIGLVCGGALGFANKIRHNHIHHIGGIGIQILGSEFSDISRNNIHHCKSAQIVVEAVVNTYVKSIIGNTIDAGESDGITIANAATFAFVVIENNIISNHAGASKVGLKILTGTAALNDKLSMSIKNFFYNNTSHRSGVSAASDDVDLSVDPYTSQSTGDYSLNATAGGGAAVRAAAYPNAVFPNSLTRSYLDGGAVQHADPAASGGASAHTFVG